MKRFSGRRLSQQMTWFVFASVVFVGFQNCSKGGFVSPSTSIDLGSQGDIDVPIITLLSEIPTLSNSRNLTVGFNITIDPSVTLTSVTCQLDTSPATNCASLSVSFSNIADGDHSLTINATDSSGQNAPAVIALFRIDATAPVVTLNSTPPSSTGSTSANFVFTANDALSGVLAVECSLDAAAYSVCISPLDFTGLAMGGHTFNVRARDLAGNTSAISSYSWSISPGSPVINLTQTPASLTNSTSATFAFNGNIGGTPITVFQCSLDNAAFANCTSPRALSGLGNGAHSFRVQGQLPSGGYSTPVSYSWTVDTLAPSAPSVMLSVTSPTSSTSAQLTFSSTDASGISSYRCSLDGAAAVTCTSPRTISGLSNGSHQMSITAIDNATNTSTATTVSWVVDNVAPTITLTATPPASTTETSAAFTFTVTDSGAGVNSIECQLDSAAYAACTSPMNYSGLSIGSHRFNVRARDRVNNERIVGHSWSVTSGTPVTGGLVFDMSYVDQSSPQFARFKAMVDAAVGGNPDYGFEPQHAALMYRITGQAQYCNYAVQYAETCPSRYENQNGALTCGVVAAETAINNGQRPHIAADSYLEVGPKIGSMAITYDWCGFAMTQAQKNRWKAVADQSIFNVWNPNQASWGGVSYPWTGWSIDNPGNNYYYSFVEATMYWALASQNQVMRDTILRPKLQALVNYYAALPGGGSLEGTGYGAAHMRLFQLYQAWKDSTGEDMANMSSHLTDSIRFWTHASTPNRAYYAPIGDLSRSSFPDLFDYHRRIVLAARRLTNSSAAQDLASWWLNHISVTQMSRRVDSQWDMLPAGTSTAPAPNEALTYHATGVGRLFTRTGWDTSALWLSIGAGPYNESHAHQDQGAFTLANNEFLAVTRNIYSSSGIEQGTEFQNVLRFMQGTTIVRQREGTVSTMTLNQVGANGDVNVTANLTPAYSGAIGNWTRNFQFANRRLLVTDQFSVSSDTQAIFQLQVPVQPTINGNLITAGNLRVRVLSPANPTITVLNQNRYRIDISGGTTGYTVEMSDQNLP